jgi:hypothetical protein
MPATVGFSGVLPFVSGACENVRFFLVSGRSVSVLLAQDGTDFIKSVEMERRNSVSERLTFGS